MQALRAHECDFSFPGGCTAPCAGRYRRKSSRDFRSRPGSLGSANPVVSLPQAVGVAAGMQGFGLVQNKKMSAFR